MQTLQYPIMLQPSAEQKKPDLETSSAHYQMLPQQQFITVSPQQVQPMIQVTMTP